MHSPRVLLDSGISLPAVYARKLSEALLKQDWSVVRTLTSEMFRAWQARRQVFLCGNGGSAANAVHLANDFLYPLARGDGGGMRVMALPANVAVVSCLANDLDYSHVFDVQLEALANEDDLLIVLSGSGNSENVVNALHKAREMGMTTFAIVAFDGGRCRELADHVIHFPIEDMQLAEDLQLVVGHMVMQSLSAMRAETLT